MYTITFPIPAFPIDERRVLIPTGLARDILTQVKYQPQLRLICPTAPDRKTISDPYEIDLAKHPGLSFRFLPWDGRRWSWLHKFLTIRKILIEEARLASVWHSCCSTQLWDVSTLAYQIGQRYSSGLRVFCLDSDPAAMLATSTGLDAIKAPLVRYNLERRTANADAAIFLGQGVNQNYRRFAKRSIVTDAVWLQAGDLATASETNSKFKQITTEPTRILLPSRLMAWKGVDDVIQALSQIGDQLPPWQLDIMGEGPEKQRLVALAARSPYPIRFLDPVPYGPEFFATLRSYHVVIVPTRAVETQRITYDAVASGCVLLHSATITLEDALKGLELRWNFTPGNVESLAEAILTMFNEQSCWAKAGLMGLAFAKERTIEQMHYLRAEFLKADAALPNQITCNPGDINVDAQAACRT